MNVLSSSHCWGKMLAFAKEVKNIGINKFLTNYFLFFLHLIENEQKRKSLGTNCLLPVLDLGFGLARLSVWSLGRFLRLKYIKLGITCTFLTKKRYFCTCF